MKERKDLKSKVFSLKKKSVKYRDMQDYDAALNSLNKAKKLSPDDFDVYNQIASVFFAQGKFEPALQNFITSLDLYNVNPYPKDILLQVLLNIGECAYQLGLHQNALEALTQLLELDITNKAALHRRAQIYLSLGELEKGLADCKQIIYLPDENSELDNKVRAHAYFDIMTSSHLPPTIEDIEWMERDMERSRPQFLLYYFFALAEGFERLQMYENAFKYLKMANEFKRETISYDAAKVEATFTHYEANFSTALSQNIYSNNEQQPIFIVGLPRSGTTLIESILCENDTVYSIGEPQYLHQQVSEQEKQHNKLNPELFASLKSEDISTMLNGYNDAVAKDHGVDPEKFRILDKLPGNFIYVGLIFMLFPNAKIIHCYKNPMDACFSLYKKPFKSGHDYAYDLNEIGHFYCHYRKVMAIWEKLFPGKIFHLEYESLVSEPQEKAKEVFEYCNLSWHDDYLNFYHSNRKVETASKQQVRQGIYKSAMQRWRNYDVDGQLDSLKIWLKEFIDSDELVNLDSKAVAKLPVYNNKIAISNIITTDGQAPKIKLIKG